MSGVISNTGGVTIINTAVINQWENFLSVASLVQNDIDFFKVGCWWIKKHQAFGYCPQCYIALLLHTESSC